MCLLEYSISCYFVSTTLCLWLFVLRATYRSYPRLYTNMYSSRNAPHLHNALRKSNSATSPWPGDGLIANVASVFQSDNLDGGSW